MIGNSNNEAANRPVANPSKTFANISSAKMKLPKTQVWNERYSKEDFLVQFLNR